MCIILLFFGFPVTIQRWKDKHTRYNQLRFINEISNHTSLINKDGLSTLEYHLYGKTKNNNIIHMNVGI